MKHIKGPWQMFDQDASVWTADGVQVAHCMSKAGGGMNWNMEQNRANARLIAAAPDLLVVLKASLPWVAKAVADQDSVIGQRVLDQANYVLTKAGEGR